MLFSFFFFIAVSFAFGQNQQSNISNAILLPAGNFESDYLFDAATNEMWFSFVADKDRMTFSTMHSASYSSAQNIEIDSLVLYNSSMSLIASARSPRATSDSLPAIQILNLVPGNTYYIKLTKYNSADAGFLNLSKTILHSSVIPSPCTPCAFGTNLICNGDFEILPSWAVGNCYADSSLTYSNNPPLPATNGYCISSPNLRNEGCSWGSGDVTDMYVISNYMSGNYQDVAEHGSYFMGVDCPSSDCVPCSLTNNPPHIWTPNYTAIAWQENIGVAVGNPYQFSCWLEDLDNSSISSLPGANVSIVINTDTLFSDIISYGNGYGSWKQVEFCWMANSSTANIQILGKGTANGVGYDFGLDNIAFVSTTTITLTNTVINVVCNGGNTGVATVTAFGGVSPYTYSWSPGGGTTASETGLTAGSYTVHVTDHNGCAASASTTITQTNALTVSVNATNNVLCNGGSDGDASAITSGGILPFTYTWSGGGGTNSTATGLSAGTYTVFVQDSCGALARASVTITQPTILAATGGATSNVSCNGGNNGSATVTAIGGTIPYTYLWTPSGKTTATATGLSALTYSILVTDSHGCTTTTNVSITQPLALRITPSILSNITCNGNNTGSITAAVGGGTSPYVYVWSGGRGTTLTISNLSAGTYTLTVTDNNGCTGTASARITQPDTLSVSARAIGVSCYGENSGSASSTISGGTLPYTYSWSNGQSTANATHLIVRTYTLTVQDSCGDVAVTTVLITQPPALSITENSIPDPGNCIGSAWVNVSGGTPAYTYLWSPGGNTTDSIYHKCPGSYCCTVTDAHGCTDSVCINIKTTAGIDNITSGSGQIKIYPNPNNGQFTIETSGISGNLFVEIYNVLGQEIKNEELRENTTVINLNSQPNEIYLYRVLKESGQLVGEGKIIISR